MIRLTAPAPAVRDTPDPVSNKWAGSAQAAIRVITSGGHAELSPTGLEEYLADHTLTLHADPSRGVGGVGVGVGVAAALTGGFRSAAIDALIGLGLAAAALSSPAIKTAASTTYKGRLPNGAEAEISIHPQLLLAVRQWPANTEVPQVVQIIGGDENTIAMAALSRSEFSAQLPHPERDCVLLIVESKLCYKNFPRFHHVLRRLPGSVDLHHRNPVNVSPPSGRSRCHIQVAYNSENWRRP